MVLSKQAVTERRKNQILIVPQVMQKMQHPLSSTNVKNKQPRYLKSQSDGTSRCFIT